MLQTGLLIQGVLSLVRREGYIRIKLYILTLTEDVGRRIGLSLGSLLYNMLQNRSFLLTCRMEEDALCRKDRWASHGDAWLSLRAYPHSIRLFLRQELHLMRED